MRVKFFSDSNLDGFVQSIATRGFDYKEHFGSWTLEVEAEKHEIERLADEWGGEILDA